MGRAVTIANERTRIKSVVKWLMPSSECARAKFRNDILKTNDLTILFYIVYKYMLCSKNYYSNK